MPRFFFTLQDDDVELRDEDGQAFASVDEAERHGRVVASELGRNRPFATSANCAILITDQTGAQVARIPLSDVSESGEGRPPSQRTLR